MDYYIEKMIEYRLDDARRTQTNVDFVRELRELEQRGRRAFRRSLTSRFTNWIPVRVSEDACDGGAA